MVEGIAGKYNKLQKDSSAMKQIVSIDPENPHRASFQVHGQSGGCGMYAKVTVVVELDAEDRSIVFSGSEFAWLKDVYGPDAWEWPICGEFREGAVFGVRWAIEHMKDDGAGKFARTIIERIHAMPADTNRDTVAYAACHATWAALGGRGSVNPSIEEGKVYFPTD